MNPAILSSFQLTGRVATHVREVPELGARLHADVVEPAFNMRAAAAAAGLDLAIVSSFRDFDRQVLIWNAKYRGERPLLDRGGRLLNAADLDDSTRVDAILLWSALPGASRHHWGTDIDVIDRRAVAADYRPQLTVDEFSGGGPFAQLNAWLGANLGNHGFFRPYTTYLGGVQPEPWHLSYAPVAVPALQHLSLEVLYEAIERSEILGRDHVLARLPGIHAKYVMAVDSG
ncbi:MAG: M15 family metallopeptidase [Gammaproteobacteria bacterium]